MRRGMSHAIRTDRSRRHGQFAKRRSAGRGSGGPRSEWGWSASSGDGPFALSCPARLRQPPAAAELDAGPGLPARTPGAGEAAGADTRRRPRELRRQEERVPGHRAPPAVRGHQVRWVALSPAREPRAPSRSRASCPLFLFSKCLHVPSSVSSPCRGIHRPWQVGGAPQGRAPRRSRRSRGKSRGRPAGTSSSQLTCRQPRHGPALRCPPLSLVRALGNEDIAIFLLRHGAFFCSYILLDSPDPSKRLLRKYFIEASALPSGCSGKMVSGHRPRIRG